MANIFEDIFDLEKKVTIQYESPSGTKELLKLDATISEGHKMASNVTKHEIEDGSYIGDHVIKEPRSLVIDGVISDDPINLFQAAVGNISGVVGSLVSGRAGAIATGVISKITSNLISQSPKPSLDAYKAFELIWENDIPVIIITGLKTYTNMVMILHDVPRNVRNTKGLEFTATFAMVNVANSEVVNVPLSALASSAVPSSAEKVKQGKKGLNDVNSKVSERGSSFLRDIGRLVE